MANAATPCRTFHVRQELGRYAAAALVFGASASVLVVELVALRLLAPYLGLTLETNTIVIGLALAAIAMGSWAGGRLADRIPPRHALGPLLAVSGVAVASTPFAVRGAGVISDSLLMATAGLAIIVPGALLAAVTPMVTKLRLRSLSETGTVVGQVAGIDTAGAIVGTVVTGFVLISRVPVSGIMVGLGAALVIGAAVVELRVRGWRSAAVPAALVLLGGAAAAAAPGGCDAETIYHCAVVQTDPDRASGRVLLLDGAPHSYVDLADPTYLEQVRRGTSSLVSEIDPGVVKIDREQLGVKTGNGIEVLFEDGRLRLGQLAGDSQDLVIGDAFGGVSVPWHLTTREAVGEVKRVLADDGIYVVNLLDYGPLAFARAEVATLAAVFNHVALATETDTLTQGENAGGNLVVIASDAPVDAGAIDARLAEQGIQWDVIGAAELAKWTGAAPVLTDDYAPVDQLLTPYPDR